MRSIMAGILLATVAATSGCSSAAEDQAATGADASNGWKGVAVAVSGSRLRARFVTGSGGRELVGFHDSVRNEDCTFQPAEYGSIRCLPPTSRTDGFFSDPACTIPMTTLPACGDVKYAVSYSFDQNGCGNAAIPEKLWRVEAGTDRYVQGVGGCAPASATIPAAAPGTRALSLVSWADFVSAVETVVPGDPIAEKVLVASDGARQHLGFRIEPLDVDCTFQLMPDGFTRCVPEAPTGPVTFKDASCTQALLVTDNQRGGPCAKKPASKFWREPSIGICAGARAVYSLRESEGGDVAPYDSELYSPSLSSSGSSSGPASVTCRSIGSNSSGGTYPGQRAIEADVTASLPTTARVSSGGERLVPALVAIPPTTTNPAPDGLTLGWHDKNHDADCTFTLATDGKVRCLPTGAVATIFFTDDKCTSPSRVAVLGEVPCAGTVRFARVVTQTCPAMTRVFALGTERRNLTIGSTETSPGRCATVQGVTSALDATEADPSGFVEGVALTE